MIELLSIIFISMVIGHVWIILIQPEYILDWMGRYIDMAMRFPRLHKLLTCSVCMAGQCALWIYPISLYFRCVGYPDCFTYSYSIVDHFCVVVTSIWLTAVVNRFINTHD